MITEVRLKSGSRGKTVPQPGAPCERAGDWFAVNDSEFDSDILFQAVSQSVGKNIIFRFPTSLYGKTNV